LDQKFEFDLRERAAVAGMSAQPGGEEQERGDDKPYLHSIGSSNVQQRHNSKQSTMPDFMT
jgi:hypothetical protein